MAARRDQRKTIPRKSRAVDGGGPPREEPDGKSPARRALDNTFQNHESLRRGLTENLKVRRVESDEVVERVEKAFAKLSLSPPAQSDRSALNCVAPGARTFDTVKKVVDRQVEAIRKSDAGPTVYVRERSALVNWDKKRTNVDRADAGGTGTLKLERVLNFVTVGQSGPVSASTPSVAALLEAEADAQKFIDAIAGTDKGGELQIDQDEDRTAADLDAAKLVAAKVDVQMRSVTAPEDQLTYGLIPNGANDDKTQKKLLETFQLRPGASDVTSYHDFHNLQIAFEHVWTRLFDGDLEKLGKDLYREYVGLKDFLGYDPESDRPITSLDDLKWLINEIRSLSQFVQEAVPPELKGDEAGTDPDPAPKGASNVTADVARVAGAILTGGLSAIAEAAINEISKFFSKPIKSWADLNGQKLDRGDRLTAILEYGVGNPGSVELALRTDVGSKWKGFKVQIFDPPSGKWVDFTAVTNAGMQIVTVNGRRFYASSWLVPSTLLPEAVIEFSSEESPGWNQGRYLLTDLADGDRLRDGSRITFYWQDR